MAAFISHSLGVSLGPYRKVLVRPRRLMDDTNGINQHCEQSNQHCESIIQHDRNNAFANRPGRLQNRLCVEELQRCHHRQQDRRSYHGRRFEGHDEATNQILQRVGRHRHGFSQHSLDTCRVRDKRPRQKNPGHETLDHRIYIPFGCVRRRRTAGRHVLDQQLR
jgi:hypothetical protein